MITCRDWNQVKDKHRQLVEAVVQVVLEPEKNGIQAKKN